MTGKYGLLLKEEMSHTLKFLDLTSENSQQDLCWYVGRRLIKIQNIEIKM